ncbi:transglutaminase-like domain-containing protein [Butyrivibrio sp. YAB3001]|uniref:transglutaminase-like domain-containing protein n=1 Tax=Butyrivibrio sp. YAB3001 TaxID=1520812 RepID=UPI000B294EAE|nr:transglutaminase-like domain-containing protein [Butyrivibrio sp. YAB3001]
MPREKGSRDNTPVCLVPEAPGVTVYENEYAHLDASNISEGYLTVKYTGSSGKVKLQITGPTEITYTYNLTVTTPTDEVFPLQSGNGQYIVNVFENLEGTKYTTVFSQMLDVQLSDEFKPFLYPNQYVTFSKDSQAVAKGQDLAYVCNNELEVVSEVYNFMIKNITYDYEEAETVQSGYIPDIDEVLSTKKGICLDYAALMTSMLRSQQIPTRMEIGYAGTAYHAWLSTYITDIGWVNGMIEFDGKEWSLMDPTFASNTDDKSLKDFIGDGKNYSVKYVY